MKYLGSLITGILAIYGNLHGGHFVWMNTAAMLVLFVALDWLLPTVVETERKENSVLPTLILLLHVVSHTIAIAILIIGASNHFLSGYVLVGAIISTGLNAGISGIISAHELIHRKQSWMQALGVWNLLLVHYSHFFIEHIKNHHKQVGTMRDPATARKNESLYAFFVRTIPAQFISAFTIGNAQKKWHQNIVLRLLVAQLSLDIAIVYFFGNTALIAFVAQSLIAILLLEYVNYIEHYGLVRVEGSKYTAQHAWQSDAITSRITLLELSRHSDHHLKASKPYHELVSHPGSPTLPGGYFGMFYCCLIPALWFRMVNPLLSETDKT